MYKLLKYSAVLVLGQALLNQNDNQVNASWNIGSNPGMMIRLEEKTLLTFKKSMQNFLPWYFDHDL
jgi:hypothetical protein